MDLANQRISLAEEYMDARCKYGKLKSDLNVILASRIQEINAVKKNAGYDTAMLILISIDKSLTDTYREMIESYDKFKAFDRLLDAIAAKQSSIQSVMRNNRMND